MQSVVPKVGTYIMEKNVIAKSDEEAPAVVKLYSAYSGVRVPTMASRCISST